MWPTSSAEHAGGGDLDTAAGSAVAAVELAQKPSADSTTVTASSVPATASPAIHAVGLSKRFGNTVAVRSLSMTVERGEVFGFLGPNGAG
ncbi:MAG: hypothetical protein ACRDV4_05305, partial [Acidimicrobiales bacterium]